RAEAVAAALLLVEERRCGARRELAHPGEEPLVRVAPGRHQDIGRTLPPLRRDDHHPEPVGAKRIGKRASRAQPAAHAVAARLRRPALVDRAAALAAEMTRRARLHLVAVDRAQRPAVAAGSAASALPRLRGLNRDDGAVAFFVFLAASARTRI